MEENVFPFSKEPNYIEGYRCYLDPARDVLVDGLELWKNRKIWKPHQKKRWNFFYRPIKSAVGIPQEEMILARKKLIREHEKDIENYGIISATMGGICIILAIVGVLQALVWLTVIGPGLPGLVAVALLYKRERLRGEVRKSENEIEILQHEIEQLVAQIPPVPPVEEIEQEILSELIRMERKCLGKVINADVDEHVIKEVIRHEQICPPMQGLLVQGWGLLQPIKVDGPFGPEGTGLRPVYKDIGGAIATWRSGSAGNPIYRVLYLQYIFLLEKNINVYSFFYDCVTRKEYGCKSESFQYNHVTNFSIREVELEENDVTKYLADGFRKILLGEEVNVFALAVGSGAHFKCVLVDETVVRNMNKWLELEERWDSLDRDEIDIDRLNQRFGYGSSLVEDYIREEEVRRAEIRKNLARERIRQEDQEAHIAQKALQQIRLRVESYAEQDWAGARREVA